MALSAAAPACKASGLLRESSVRDPAPQNSERRKLVCFLGKRRFKYSYVTGSSAAPAAVQHCFNLSKLLNTSRL